MLIYEAKVSYRAVQDLGTLKTVETPDAVRDYMKGAFDEDPMHESVWVVCLNRRYKPLCRTKLTVGTQSSCLVSVHQVLRTVLLAYAQAFVLVHNHPSGDPSPSSGDAKVTRELREASRIMDITFLDHVIIGRPEDDPNHAGYYSFRASGSL